MTSEEGEKIVLVKLFKEDQTRAITIKFRAYS